MKREKADMLQVLEILNRRMVLTNELLRYLKSLQKGYEGELQFDELIVILGGKCIILRDVRLKMNNTVFQMDAILIVGDRVFIFEIKNFSDKHEYREGGFVRMPDFEMDNPFEQMEKCVRNLHYLLKTWGFHFTVVGKVVFVNPTFFLFNAPVSLPMLHLQQIPSFLEKIDRMATGPTHEHERMAKKLKDSHLPAQPKWEILPEFSFESLEKNMYCAECEKPVGYTGRVLVCRHCQKNETVSSAILRNTREFQVLFPNEKITSKKIYQWTNGIISKRQVQYHLKQHMVQMGSTQGTHYKISD